MEDMRMKAFFYKTRGIAALAMAMMLSTTPAFAADPAALSAEAQGVQTAKPQQMFEAEAEVLPKLTEADAYEKAVKNSPNLREIQEQIDYLYETKGDLWDKGFTNTPTYEHMTWHNAGLHAVNSSLFQINEGIEQGRYGQELAKLGLEVAVKSYFTTIHTNLDNLKMAKENVIMQEKLLDQAELKYKLGMMSKYNYEKQQTALKQAKDSITQLENTLEQQYIKLNDLMGEKPETRFEYVYETTFAPYVPKQDLEIYITNKTQNELSIKMLESQLEITKFNKNYLSETATSATMDQNELAYDKAMRALKTARTAMDLNIRSTMLQIRQLETAYETAVTDLEKAQADYRAVQVSYQAGNTTKLAVEQARMGILQKELALKSLAYNHDMLIFSFEHPSLLGGSASAGK